MNNNNTLPKQLAVNLPKDLHHRLKLQAVHRDQSIQSIVVAALEAHLPAKIDVIERQKRSANG